MNLDELRDKATLTDEAIDALVLQEFPDFPIHDEVQYARGLARIMVGAARDKALAAAFEAMGNTGMEVIIRQMVNPGCLCHPCQAAFKAIANYRALKEEHSGK